jgi:hypothetical protein
MTLLRPYCDKRPGGEEIQRDFMGDGFLQHSQNRVPSSIILQAE